MSVKINLSDSKVKVRPVPMVCSQCGGRLTLMWDRPSIVVPGAVHQHWVCADCGGDHWNVLEEGKGGQEA